MSRLPTSVVSPEGYWVVVRDHRFDLDYEISCHSDYWDFIGALVDHRQYIGRVIESGAGREERPAVFATAAT